MEKIQVQYFGSVSAAAKKTEEKVDFVPDATVYNILRKLACDNEKYFQDEIFGNDGESLRDDLTVTVNGKAIDHSIISEINLQPGDSLALFPIFPGGG